MLERLQTLLNDPIAGPKLVQMLNNPNTSVGSQLANIGSYASKQTTPSGQIGAGIGGMLGLGLQQLFKKKTPTVQQGGGDLAPGSTTSSGGNPNQGLTANAAYGDYSDEMDPIMARRGGKIKRKFAEGGDVGDVPHKPPKRAVLVRRPILSTTIVIAKKPPGKAKKAVEKVEKKARGGAIKSVKPDALPPRRGPGFRKGGQVRTPRGAGIAQRGKQFRGIY